MGGQWVAERVLQKLESLDVFDEKDYQSNDGMQTAIFGPVFWMALHLVSFNYPMHPTDVQKKQYRRYIKATGDVLPCRYCRENFRSNFERASRPGDFDSRERLSRFVYRLHEEVNTMLNKPSGMSFEHVRDLYEGFRSRCLSTEEQAAILAQSNELGCREPKHVGTKGKCLVTIVPRERTGESLVVDHACQLRRR